MGDLYTFAISILSGMHNRIHSQQPKQDLFWERTIPIECGELSSTDFEVSEEMKIFLVKSGYESTRLFLSTRMKNIKMYGSIPENIFIPSKGTEKITNDMISDTHLFCTNTDKFRIGDIMVPEELLAHIEPIFDNN